MVSSQLMLSVQGYWLTPSKWFTCLFKYSTHQRTYM